jgi:hypothetical protein
MGVMGKSEIRNLKSESKPKAESRKPKPGGLAFGAQFLVSDFRFQISDLIRISVFIFLIFPLLLLAGCASSTDLPTTRPNTDVPIEQATADYWYRQPDPYAVESLDFDKIWAACERAARDFQFQIDWMDYRQGVLSTRPIISKMVFEVWRSDAGTAADTLQDSLQTIRRTIRFEVTRSPDGSYIAHPKVLKERLSEQSQRITSVEQYSSAFLPEDSQQRLEDERNGAGPTRYWYAFGRDGEMEKELADEVRDKVK